MLAAVFSYSCQFVKLPVDSTIAREKVTGYLLVRQGRNDKSAFLERGGYTAENPEALIAALGELREHGDARLVDDNQFGVYYEVIGDLGGCAGIRLRVKTVWMTEHLSGITKFITLIPIETLAT
jgi:hypothetical protein